MDNDLFHAEEVSIGEELDKLSSSEQIRQWATHYGLSQHPLVLRRLGEHRCDQCGKSFTQKKNLNRHIQTKHGGQKFSCVKCHRVYTWNSDRVKHERTCTGIPLKMATFDCDVCKKKCVTERGLQTHRQVHVRPPKRSGNDVKTLPAKRPRQTESQPGTECRTGTNRDIYCRRCNANFTSRRELYLHGMREHYQQGQGMQTSPYAQVPFEDEKLKEVYDANAPLILEEDRERPVQSVYNVPVANDVSVDVLMREAEKIYERQHHAFRLNLSLGVILRNTETGEYRYFKPYENDTLLESPLIVTRREDLEKLRLRLRQMDVTTYFLRQRPDTKWKPFLFTNIRFVVYDTKFVLRESAGDLPDYVLNNIAIEALERNKKLNQRYDDKLCAFRCFSLHKGQSVDNLETASRMYLRRWLEYLKARNRTGHVDINPVTFSGIQFFDLPDFENCFQVNINAYQLREDGTALSVYKSRCRFAETMYVNMHGNHLSYIKDFKMYAKKYQCRTCEKHFHRSNNLHRHQRVCTNQTKYKYPGGFFQAPQTIFDKLAEVDVVVPESDRTFPWFVVYDFEAALQKVNVQTSEKLKWTHEHVPISVSVCSNVPGHTEATCFVKPEADELIEVMMEQMQTIAQAVKRLAESKWGKYKEKLEDKIQQWEGEEVMQNQLKSVCGQLVGYMSQVPVLGFNSARYDINLIKRKLVGYLHGDEHLFVVKKNNAYMCISTETLKFLDVSQFLTPGTSYVKFLKAYRVEEQKGYFPYEWFSDLSKLEVSSLPSHGAFYSSLKDSNISKEEYQYCQKVWREKNMDTFKDFLVWYNNLDVVPFVEAVTRLQEFYFRRNIDVFKTAISVPGIARQMLFATARKAEANFALFDLKNKELYETVKNNIVGGPSIIFTRHHKAHVTRIRGKKKCRKIIGFDANALYLWAIGEEMPVGPFVIRKAENDFRPENRDKYMAAYHWMNWLNVTGRADIQHKLNHGSEKRVGKYPVDGWDAGKNTIYQFHGCYFHGHECQVTQNVKDQKWWENRENRYKNTQETTKYLRGKGYRVEEMWECEYRQYCKDNPKIYDMIDATRPKFHQKHKGKVTEKQILNGVRSGQLFGMVEVDIEVPERWNSEFHRKMSPLHYFEEMSPLFCNSEVPFELIGQHMQEHVKKFGLWDKPRSLLVGGMKAKQMLIATPLLKWYLDHGMKVSKIYQVVEFQAQSCFKEFVREVSDARRAGDVKPELAIIADTRKLIGNSGYGSLIMDKTKHRTVKYVKGEKEACLQVNIPQFRKLESVDEPNEIYEVELAKNEIKLDLPIQLGYFILQYAKLRMLQFYYDFMDVYVERTDFEYCEMDTDSAYMAISAESLDEIIKPEMWSEYQLGLKGFCNQIPVVADADLHWFPRTCCSKHAKYDKRTPGLFKVEYEGDEMIGLCSKTYIVSKSKELTTPVSVIVAQQLLRRAKKAKPKRLRMRSRKTKEKKFSSKGISKRLVEAPFSKFSHVLQTQRAEYGLNKGFRVRNNRIFTYEQKTKRLQLLLLQKKSLERRNTY